MAVLDNLLLGFSVALSPVNLLLAVAGCAVGTLLGALPGVGPVSGVALLLPLTFGMDPAGAVIMLAGIYYGSMYGGTITSVLINTPGESASVVTCLDGHQMARQGRAGVALGVAALGSFVAGTFGVVMLMLAAPTLAEWALSFGPPENFALMLVGLTTVTGLTGTNALKGYISMVLGLMIAMVGFDIVSGAERYTAGVPFLLEGVDFLPVAIGLFGLGEALTGAEEIARADTSLLRGQFGLKEVWPTAEDWRRSRGPIARGSILGFFIGVLPGAGTTVASFIAYVVEKKVSRHPGRFGTGMIEGVAGPEAANNSGTAGAMVPMLTLGIPGSGTTAILLGGLMMWGLQPGPLLFTKNPDFVWGLIASMYIGNVVLVVMNIAFIPLFVQALRVPYTMLMSLIVVLCVIGAYSLRNTMFDVWLMLGFGIVGYLMKKLDYSPAALVLALVLGGLSERALRQSLLISNDQLSIFFTRPIAAVLMVIAITAVSLPAVRALWRLTRGEAARRRAAA